MTLSKSFLAVSIVMGFAATGCRNEFASSALAYDAGAGAVSGSNASGLKMDFTSYQAPMLNIHLKLDPKTGRGLLQAALLRTVEVFDYGHDSSAILYKTLDKPLTAQFPFKAAAPVPSAPKPPFPDYPRGSVFILEGRKLGPVELGVIRMPDGRICASVEFPDGNYQHRTLPCVPDAL